MNVGILGTKLGMTQIFDESGYTTYAQTNTSH